MLEERSGGVGGGGGGGGINYSDFTRLSVLSSWSS